MGKSNKCPACKGNGELIKSGVYVGKDGEYKGYVHTFKCKKCRQKFNTYDK